MNFDSNHYVPVLKVKRAEKAALKLLSAAHHASITPLLEIVQLKKLDPPTISEHLDTSFKNLPESVEPFSRSFVDAREVSPEGPQAANEVFQRAAAAGMNFTPVTGISRTVDVAAALSHKAGGLALRLIREEFESGVLVPGLRKFLATHGLSPDRVDLIVDLGAVDDMIAAGVAALAAAFVAAVPDAGKWRTLTLSSCAIPKSMGGVKKHSHELFERSDWIAWRDGLHASRVRLARLPAFSDCAIQHVVGVEGFDPRKMKASASVRYTTADSWLFMKGESVKVTSSVAQYPGMARQLVSGHLSQYFAGAAHCDGCASIRAASLGTTKGLGALEVWRRLGTVHHLTTVVHDLAALTWP